MRASGSRPEQPDHYAILGVPADATPRQITRAYRALARALHPDTADANCDTPARFTAVTTAYAVLHDPDRRAAYDRTRRTAAGAPSSTHAPTPATTTRRVRITIDATPLAQPLLDVRPASPPHGYGQGQGHAREPLLRVGPTRVRPLPSREG
jgi:curved DNA-binding protein CbpA